MINWLGFNLFFEQEKFSRASHCNTITQYPCVQNWNYPMCAVQEKTNILGKARILKYLLWTIAKPLWKSLTYNSANIVVKLYKVMNCTADAFVLLKIWLLLLYKWNKCHKWNILELFILTKTLQHFLKWIIAVKGNRRC